MAKRIGVVRRALQQVQGVFTAPEKWAFQQGLRTAGNLTLPDFLGIGAQKGGTSWLYENLRCHPELYLPDQKELHFFDRRYHRPIRSYAAKFSAAGSRKKGEITPSYGDLPLERIRFIHSVIPDARLLLMLRDPIQRAWSHAQMHLLVKIDKPRPDEELRVEEVLEHIRGRDSRGKGGYRAIMQNWTSVFPEEQLFVGFFEDVSARPEELLLRVFRHLGVSTDVPLDQFPLREVVNRGRKNRMPEPVRDALLELYAEELEWLRARFGPAVAHWGTRRP